MPDLAEDILALGLCRTQLHETVTERDHLRAWKRDTETALLIIQEAHQLRGETQRIEQETNDGHLRAVVLMKAVAAEIDESRATIKRLEALAAHDPGCASERCGGHCTRLLEDCSCGSVCKCTPELCDCATIERIAAAHAQETPDAE